MLRSFLARASREPVLFGAAVIAGARIGDLSPAVDAFVVALVAWGQRAFSTAKATAEEATAQARIDGQNELAAFAASEPDPPVKSAPRRKP